MKRSYSAQLCRIGCLAALSSSFVACGHPPSASPSPGPPSAPPVVEPLDTAKLSEITALVDGLQERVDMLQRIATPLETKEKSPPPPTPTPGPSAKSELNGRQILDKINAVVPAAPAIEAEAVQMEKNLKTGRMAMNSMRFYVRQPGVIKIELLSTTKNELGVAAGAKLLYVSGRKTVTVRPAGVLLKSFTAELQQTDGRLLSENGLTLSQLDFYGMSQRFSQPIYQAERIGKTQLEGQEVHVLKVTVKGTHPMLSAISHELIAYDPVRYIPRYWEAYTASQKEPFFKFMVKRFAIHNQLPESVFKL